MLENLSKLSCNAKKGDYIHSKILKVILLLAIENEFDNLNNLSGVFGGKVWKQVVKANIKIMKSFKLLLKFFSTLSWKNNKIIKRKNTRRAVALQCFVKRFLLNIKKSILMLSK